MFRTFSARVYGIFYISNLFFGKTMYRINNTLYIKP